MDTVLKQQLLMQIFKLLVEQGLLSEEENNRLKVLSCEKKDG